MMAAMGLPTRLKRSTAMDHDDEYQVWASDPSVRVSGLQVECNQGQQAGEHLNGS